MPSHINVNLFVMNETLNTSTIHYFADESQYSFFFLPHLQKIITRLGNALGDNTRIGVYPDATLKSNGLPTGIVYSAKASDAVLLPHVLRDPGCGYLLFSLKFHESVPNNWHAVVGHMIDGLINKYTASIRDRFLERAGGLEKILHHGIGGGDISNEELNCFSHPFFPVDSDQIQLQTEEADCLTQDFMNLTNTIEIRQLMNIQDHSTLAKNNINENDYIGFIHNGCHLFPEILGKRFVHRIGKYAIENELFSPEDVKDGIYGVPLDSELGKEYQQWLYAAQNYAVASRYAIYLAIKEQIENVFSCQFNLIKDSPHAGLFEKKDNGETIVYSTRGVQCMQTHSESEITLLAGHRETLAALCTPGKAAKTNHNLLGHGTGCHIRDDYNYDTFFTTSEINQYLTLAENAYYNTQANYEECIPYTFNFQTALNYFQATDLATPTAMLAPVINIHSNYLIQFI